MENITGKDTSEFYEMSDRQVRDSVRTAQAYDFIGIDNNAWNVRYFKRKYGSKKSLTVKYGYCIIKPGNHLLSKTASLSEYFTGVVFFQGSVTYLNG